MTTPYMKANKKQLITPQLHTVPLSKSTAGQRDKERQDGVGCFVPVCGLVFYTMAFFSLFCALSLHVSLSVAVVAMLNQSAVTDDVQTSNATTVVGSGQCPRDVTLLDADGGEFIWNRHQQEAALATYYRGFLITQVRSNK